MSRAEQQDFLRNAVAEAVGTGVEEVCGNCGEAVAGDSRRFDLARLAEVMQRLQGHT